MLNEHFKDILLAFTAEKVRFILVGAYAMVLHGHRRTTGDIDLWVEPSEENAKFVLRALENFGAPLHNLNYEDLIRDDTVFQIGLEPFRIDIITGASGLEFDEAYNNSQLKDLDGVKVMTLSLDDLIKNKSATGRLQDLADVEKLTALKRKLDSGEGNN
ncbi:nucleotidyltransferase [bacterium]|nr:nucleotidyltransferase [bacterium]